MDNKAYGASFLYWIDFTKKVIPSLKFEKKKSKLRKNRWVKLYNPGAMQESENPITHKLAVLENNWSNEKISIWNKVTKLF